MIGKIWSLDVFSFKSPLKDLLVGGQYTFEQLSAEDKLVQEIRGIHTKFMDFLSTKAAVTGLVHYMIQSPAPPKPLLLALSSSAVEEAGAAPLATTIPSATDDASTGITPFNHSDNQKKWP